MIKDKQEIEKTTDEQEEKLVLSKYINPLTDFGFKHLFGAKDLLIDFLNSILDIDGGIKDLTYANTEKTPRSPKERKSFFDLHCITRKGERIIIEIQHQREKNFIDRVLTYIADAIKEQTKRGKKTDETDLAPLYSINIVDFRIAKKKTDKSISYVKLIDIDTKEVFYKKLTLVFLELPRFNKKVTELKTTRDVWMFVLTNLKKLDKLPNEIRNDIFEKLFQMAEVAALSEKDRNEYYQSLKNYHKMYSVVEEKNKIITDLRKKNVTYKQENVTYKQENVTYKQQVAEYQQREAASLQREAAKDKIIEDLMQRLALSGAQSN